MLLLRMYSMIPNFFLSFVYNWLRLWAGLSVIWIMIGEHHSILILVQVVVQSTSICSILRYDPVMCLCMFDLHCVGLKTFKIYLIQFHIELSSLPLILLITATKKGMGGVGVQLRELKMSKKETLRLYSWTCFHRLVKLGRRSVT